MSCKISALFILLISSLASAGGFRLSEQSASGIGRASSGEAAIGDDASIVGANPAGMALLTQGQFVGMLAYVKPGGEMFVESSSIDVDMSLFSVEGRASTQVEGNQIGNAFAGGQVMPTLYYVMPLSKRWHLGLGAFSKFGLMQDYNDDFVGRFLLNQIQVVTFNINTSLSYRLTRRWSVGVGMNLVMAQTNMDQFIPDVAVLGGETLSDLSGGIIDLTGFSTDPTGLNGGRMRMKGSQMAVVPNFGVLYQMSRNTRFGFAYNPGYKLDMKGRTSFSDCSAANTAILGAFTEVCGDGFDSSLEVDIPMSVQASVFHRLSGRWAVHGDVSYTNWSKAGAMVIHNENASGQENVFFDASHDYRDTFRLAAGMTYRYSRRATWRFGAAFDQGFSRPGDNTVNGSDTDRVVVAAGANYRFSSRWSVDVGYLRYFFKRYEIDDSLGLANYNLGSLAVDASYEVKGNGITGLDMLAAQLNWNY